MVAALPRGSMYLVMKHRAPKGALRPGIQSAVQTAADFVRKHRAPNGALRRSTGVPGSTDGTGQKAPSAKRCIKTRCD